MFRTGPTDSGWFTANPEHPQMVASQTQQGVEYDGLYRVSVMQTSVAAGEMIEGNLGLLGGMDSNGVEFEIWDGAPGGVLYYGTVPAPGFALLLGLLGFARNRRRA